MNLTTLPIPESLLKSLSEQMGISNEPPEMQVAALQAISKTVVARVLVEVMKRIPEAERDHMTEIEGDLNALLAFVKKHIPDLDEFILAEGEKELKAVKARASELASQ